MNLYFLSLVLHPKSYIAIELLGRPIHLWQQADTILSIFEWRISSVKILRVKKFHKCFTIYLMLPYKVVL